MSLKDPLGCWWETLRRLSYYEVFLCSKKTLMKVLMSFYEDREEEGEEYIEIKEEEEGLCLV